MRNLVLLMVCLPVPACATPQASTTDGTSQGGANGVPVLITRADQLDGAVGKLVVIQGAVTETKIPTILGVDVVSDHPDLRGQRAQAQGILQKSTITKEQHDKSWAEKGPFATRGPGTFYRVLQVGSQYNAQVQPIP